MPRLFTWPTVAALEVDQGCFVAGTVAAVRRKVAPYGARNKKRFEVTTHPCGETYVKRVAVTDTDLPGA